MPLFSVITINYNNCEGLKTTVRSVLGQTSDNFEYIVIDGGSTDGSVEVIKEHASQITYWVSEPDGGIFAAMNKGCRQATGDYCLFINSGDALYDPSVLANAASQLSQEEADFVSGNMMMMKEKKAYELFRSPQSVTALTFITGGLPHQSTFIKRSWLTAYPYDEKLKLVSDWKHTFYCLVLKDASYRKIEITISAFDTSGITHSSSQQILNERASVIREYCPRRVYEDYQRIYVENHPTILSHTRLPLSSSLINLFSRMGRIRTRVVSGTIGTISKLSPKSSKKIIAFLYRLFK